MLLFKHTFQEIKKLKTNELYTQLKNLEMGKPRRKMRITNTRTEINKIQKTKENINKTNGSSLKKVLTLIIHYSASLS